jgi:hypothetical protein
MKLTHEEFKKLYASDILKSEYDTILGKIDERFGDVVKLIRPLNNRGWFDYANCDYESEDSGGEFDLDRYKDKITIGGECEFPEPYCNTDEGCGYIPTRWLWTDDTDILKEFSDEVEKAKLAVEAKKLANKQRREADKLKHRLFAEKRDEMQKSIKSKLTPDELRYISFR